MYKDLNDYNKGENAEENEKKPEIIDPLKVFDLRVLKSSLMMVFTIKSFNLSNSDQLRKLICHEFQRVYSDRLRSKEDKQSFYELLDRYMQINDRFEVDKEKIKEKDKKGGGEDKKEEKGEGEDDPDVEIKHVKLLDFSTIFTDLVKIDSSKI